MAKDKKNISLSELGKGIPDPFYSRIFDAAKALGAKALTSEEKQLLEKRVECLVLAMENLQLIIKAYLPPEPTLDAIYSINLIIMNAAEIGAYGPPAAGILKQLGRNRTAAGRKKKSLNKQERQEIVAQIAPKHLGASDLPEAVLSDLKKQLGIPDMAKNPSSRTIRRDLKELGFLTL